MSNSLRAGVIGAGVFGGYHAGKYSRMADVNLAAVLDPDLERAQVLAQRHGARPLTAAADFLAAVDVVSVSSPADSHVHWALAALKAGKSVYVEKPLATDLAGADAIVAEAARRGLVAACGFLERAALGASGLLAAPERPLRLAAVRKGVASPRNLDVSVVLDLMIHDLDLALALAPGAPFAVEAEGCCVRNALCDEAQAEVTFDDGFTARFSVSRVADAPERRLTVVYPSGEVVIDLLAGTLTGPPSFNLDPNFGETPAGRDRLGASLQAFIDAARGEGAPLADAEDGARALDLALAVEQALNA
jgi:predicted dehydrogenase